MFLALISKRSNLPSNFSAITHFRNSVQQKFVMSLQINQRKLAGPLDIQLERSTQTNRNYSNKSNAVALLYTEQTSVQYIHKFVHIYEYHTRWYLNIETLQSGNVMFVRKTPFVVGCRFFFSFLSSKMPLAVKLCVLT